MPIYRGDRACPSTSMPIYEEGSSGILYFDGSEWKLNNNDSTGGWYYNNGSTSVAGAHGKRKPHRGAESLPSHPPWTR